MEQIKIKIPLKYLLVHKCPTCNKIVTDLLEVDFLEVEGECATCEHSRAEYLDDMERFMYEEEE